MRPTRIRQPPIITRPVITPVFNSVADRLGWVRICPQVLEKTEHGWTDAGTEEFVLDLVDAALRKWRLDPDRVYLAGRSMGGYGTWMLGAHHADRVAGLVPTAGSPTPIMSMADGSGIDIVEGVIPNLRNVDMVIYHSADDPQVPPAATRMAVKCMGEARGEWGGYSFDDREVDGVDHAVPGVQPLLEEIGKYSRNPVPDRVVWQPSLRWKR